MPEYENSASIAPLLIALMKGVVYQENDPSLWQAMLEWQARVRDYLAVIGLELILDEAEAYAYLRQRQPAVGEPDLPRLVPRRPLSFPVSLLLALLRKRLAEFDAAAGDTRLILSREQIGDLLRLFLRDTANEARLMDQIDGQINRVVELGFLRKLKGQDHQFEVRRILKAFVDAQWLAEFDRRLGEYRTHLQGSTDAAEGGR